MKRSCLLLVCIALAARGFAQVPGVTGDRVLLPNGWYLSPAGKAVALTSDLPLNMAVAPDGVHLAVANNGNGRQGIDLVDLTTGQVVDTVTMHASWLGLAFARKHPWLYVSGGNDDVLLRYTLSHDRLVSPDTLRLGAPWPKEKIGPTGLALDESRDRLYVVTKEDDALYICDTRAMKVLRRVALSAEAYACVYNASRHELYVSGWGGRKVWIYDALRDRLADSVGTEDHPNDMALSRDGRWLYVANANANSVSVVDVAARKTVETLHTALEPDAPTGSTTNSVVLGPGDKTLYIANADNNYLAVYDVSKPGSSRSTGFIPVGWYPTCVRTWRGGLLVADGKGLTSTANPDGEGPYGHVGTYKLSQHGDQYIGSMLHGAVSMIPFPSPVSLAGYSRQVYANTPRPTVTAAGTIPPIQHVFYILKENRTYDQILGDMPRGNGDTSLCIFGRRVTPNAHALCDEFVLLDNFYVNAEVSADGHNWSMAGYATDFVEKTWPSNYAGRGGNYDFDGSRPIANPTRGFIWDYCARAGVSFRNYGEFEDNGPPTLPVLRDPRHYCHGYPGWNLDIQDVYRDSVFEHDFDSLVAEGSVPRFSTIYLPDDHTSGLSRGAYTPIAHVADNDLALGRIIDHISHSPVWASSAIFVLEDDAQDGPDHVDAHRSVAYIASPYIRRHSVNHTLYSTAAMLHTMELIVGLPPMSQYDAAATPMFDCFSATPDTTPYVFRPALVDINARNKAAAPVTFDFSKPDAAPDRALNEAIWQSVKGTAMPAPKRSAFVLVARSDGDD